MRTRLWITVFVLAGLAMSVVVWSQRKAHAAETPAADPAAWGADHVGEPVPEYATGTECLFCHRDYVGPRWPANPHNRTMRSPDPDDPAVKALAEANIDGLKPADVEILLGDGPNVRFLKRLQEYGKVSTSGVKFEHESAAKSLKDCLRDVNVKNWDDKKFAERCAGCHATGIDTETASMSSPSLECYVCHGLTEIEHTAKAVTAILGSKDAADAKVEAAICGQCHLRGGKSKATGRPYPTNFVPGDNLLRDFQVDFSDKALESLDPIERHIFANARDVLVVGNDSLTCTSCHSIHANTSAKHADLDESQYCAICHKPGKSMSEVALPRKRSSETCEYGTVDR